MFSRTLCFQIHPPALDLVEFLVPANHFLRFALQIRRLQEEHLVDFVFLKTGFLVRIDKYFFVSKKNIVECYHR